MSELERRITNTNDGFGCLFLFVVLLMASVISFGIAIDRRLSAIEQKMEATK